MFASAMYQIWMESVISWNGVVEGNICQMMTRLHLGYQFSTLEGNQWVAVVSHYLFPPVQGLSHVQSSNMGQRRSGRLLVSHSHTVKHVKNPDFQAISGFGTDLIRNAWDLFNLLQFHLIRLTGIASWLGTLEGPDTLLLHHEKSESCMPTMWESCAKWEVTWFDHHLSYHLPLTYHHL